MNTTINVDAREILFIKEHAPKGFSRIIADSLQSEGITVDRVTVHKEISTLKTNYNKQVIETARRLLKAIKGVEFQAGN
ncbi:MULTISPECIES: hypothetical protein [Olivibacter]|uniref:Uncharacterized protein n=1 Tax=Olivibacter jilunii TaxID=985016 RepID=A0ABW6B2X9_9SPHI